MEAVEEPVLGCNKYTNDSTKENIISHAFPCSETVIEGSHKTNGESLETRLSETDSSEKTAVLESTNSDRAEEVIVDQNVSLVEEVTIEANNSNDNNISQEVLNDPVTLNVSESNQTVDETNLITEFIEETTDGSHLILSNETVEFETEVLVEKEDTIIAIEFPVDNSSDVTNNILSALDGQNVNLPEELTSTENELTDNNNSAVKEEVFNNEELLDILEGNDFETPKSEDVVDSTALTEEAKIALQQWQKLKTRTKHTEKNKTRRSFRKKRSEEETSVSLTTSSSSSDIIDSKRTKDAKKQKVSNELLEKVDSNQPQEQEEANIVTALVKDWEDDDTEEDKSNNLIEASNIDIVSSCETLATSEVTTISTDVAKSNDETLPNIEKEGETKTKSSENGTQRRLSRVIKKKVIFDPDNPDTFTKGKSAAKIKVSEATVADKEQPSPKKIKSENLNSQDQSKSPVTKMQWKKPTLRNRLSEVDRLLMDEGAVNMIYQLTPEASKGKKNIRTKAELIKKINQTSTPEVVEKKFRDRKKDALRSSDTEAKKIPSGKQRSSVSGSVKSMTVGEGFEAHSADDSIIYRRHSSSSYSSSCMSPRRLSDVEAAGAAPAGQLAAAAAAAAAHAPGRAPPAAAANVLEAAHNLPNEANGEDEDNSFMDDSADASTDSVIKKEDCLSLKEKLKSKLSTVLNKRKRDTSKTDTTRKLKKTTAAPEPAPEIMVDDFKTLTISCDCRMAEISIRKLALKNNAVTIEMLKELENALDSVSARKDTTVTLLTSEFQLFCSRLELAPLLDENREKASNYAFELTSATRTLLLSMERHSKLLVCGVPGACEGLGVALAAMCDVTLASELASFALTSHADAPLMPGPAVLTTYRRFPRSLVSELVVFGARVPAELARRRGLAGRVLWPARFERQVRDLAADLAAQPPQTILLKKQLIGVRSRGDREALPGALAAEQDLLVDSWTSAEGRGLLREHLARL